MFWNHFSTWKIFWARYRAGPVRLEGKVRRRGAVNL